MFDGKSYGESIVEVVKGYVEREIAPLRAENAELKGRIAELESRPAPDNLVVLQLVQDEIAKIPPAENGKDADPEQVASLVTQEVERAVAAIPVPQDGKSIGVEDVAPLIAEEVAKVAPDMAVINEAIVSEVSKAVAEIPAPKDGTDAPGIVQALKDSGELVLTLANGELIRTGIRDGEKGQDGKDGRNGFELEDFDIKRGEDARTLILCFEGKEQGYEYEVTFPFPIYCGIFKEGDRYVPGDLVTWGGCLWHCDKETTEKPGATDWTLAVKKGRDGKDAKNG